MVSAPKGLLCTFPASKGGQNKSISSPRQQVLTDNYGVFAPGRRYKEHHGLVRVGQGHRCLQAEVHGPKQQEPHPAVPQRIADERGRSQQPARGNKKETYSSDPLNDVSTTRSSPADNTGTTQTARQWEKNIIPRADRTKISNATARGARRRAGGAKQKGRTRGRTGRKPRDLSLSLSLSLRRRDPCSLALTGTTQRAAAVHSGRRAVENARSRPSGGQPLSAKINLKHRTSERARPIKEDQASESKENSTTGQQQ